MENPSGHVHDGLRKRVLAVRFEQPRQLDRLDNMNQLLASAYGVVLLVARAPAFEEAVLAAYLVGGIVVRLGLVLA